MTVDEVAEYLRLNRETIVRKARKGELPVVKVGYRSYRFHRDQIDECLRKKTSSDTRATPSKKARKLDLPSYNLGIIKGSLSRREIYEDL
jgi:excisionase family DNA binding protein